MSQSSASHMVEIVGDGAPPRSLISEVQFARRPSDDLYGPISALPGSGPWMALQALVLGGGWSWELLTGRPMLGWALGLALAAVLVDWIGRLRSSAAMRDGIRQSAFPLSDRPDPAARVQCIGARELIENRGEFLDAAFEPVVARSWHGSFGPLGIGVVAILLLAFALCLPEWTLQAITPFTVLPFGVMWFVGVLAEPAYLRVTPGALELIQYRLWRRPRSTRYDLRTARVLVDLVSHQIVVQPAGQERRVSLGTYYLSPRDRTEYVVLLAAVTTKSATPLPGDALLG